MQQILAKIKLKIARKENWLTLIIFIGILLIASYFRFFQLSNVPPSPLHDEVSNGYNAYSILKTGADEFGVKFPILLRAFNDWRPAIFVYLTVPFIMLFNLSTFSVRLPAAVLSLVSLGILFLLVKELLIENKRKLTFFHINIKDFIALLTVFLFAISPWSIFLSRISNETNLSFCFFLLGLLLFLYFLNRKPAKTRYLFFSSITFAFSFNTYNAIKLFIPLFFFGLFVIYIKELWVHKKALLISFILFILFTLPFTTSFLNPGSASRFSQVSVFSQPLSVISNSAQRIAYDKQNKLYLGELFDNRRMEYLFIFTKNYLGNLNFLWLFTDQITTQSINFNIPSFGLFYLFEFPLLLLGLYFVVKSSFFSVKTLGLLALWLFTGIVPSAIAIDSPQASRTLPILPVYLIIQTVGLYFLLVYIQKIRSKIRKSISYGVLLSIIVISILWFNHAYFVNFRRENSSQFEYGLIQALQYAKKQEGNYSKILISNEGNAIRSSTYYLFTEKFDPLIYQKMGGSQSGYYAQTHKIGKFLFSGPHFFYKNGNKEIVTPEFWVKDTEKTLYIISPSDYPQTELSSINKKYFVLQKRIKYLDGTDALWVLTKI